jgi:hypothetical protein
VGNHVIDHPIRPIFNFVTDADLAVCKTSPCAAAQARLHITHPPDGIPLDFPTKMLPVNQFSALVQVSIGTMGM